jgi:hypothetical protein
MVARFWVPIAVTGTASGTGGVVRLTVGAGLATGKVTGESVTVASVGGTTEANGTFTITAVDSTHIELQGTTFVNAWTSGGSIAGGTWNATNIGNWGLTTGAAGGQTVPASGDTVTMDGASGGATVKIGLDITVGSWTWGAFTGTIDVTNGGTANYNVTITGAGGMSGNGNGARTFTGGSGTYTLSANGAAWAFTTVTNLTNPTTAFASSTIVFTGTTTGVSFAGGGLTYGTITLAAVRAGYTFAQANTIATLNIPAGCTVAFPAAVTTTITGALSLVGSSTLPIGFVSSGSTATVSLGANGTGDWVAVRSVTFTTNHLTLTNSLDLGGNTLNTGTIGTPTAGGGVVGVIGG